MNKLKPKIGISIGDYNGISIEIIIKTLLNSVILNKCNIVIFGNEYIINNYKKKLNIDIKYNLIRSNQQIKENIINLFHISTQPTNIEFGKTTKHSGYFAIKSLMTAIDQIKKKNIDTLVTAPLNKSNIDNFYGHTSTLEKEFNSDTIMIMIKNNIRIALITEHIAIKDLHENITSKKIENKIFLLEKVLKNNFGLSNPKIAILGLNPHCGDSNRFGDEEQTIIKPVIEKINSVFGPFPADSFFCFDEYKKFDATIAMYHDQGLIPFKILSQNTGVNYTGGLDIIRTSPAHGTAMDIAGKGIASPESFKQAILNNISIYNKSRKD